jgi:uncharacterized membrane protein YdjX (TVP38/TMEM64 family)
VVSGSLQSHRAVSALVTLVLASVAASGLIIASGGGPALLVQAQATLMALNRQPAVVAALFAAWALVANCLVVPAGTLSMIVGGALLGTVAPTLIWSVAQLMTAPVLYALTRRGVDSAALPPHNKQVAQLAALAQVNGFKATAMLRLLPIMPNAAATILAATAGIELRTFLIGSALTGWVRPAYFAGLGATVGSLSKIEEVTDLLSLATLMPLLLLFAGSVVVFAVSAKK